MSARNHLWTAFAAILLLTGGALAQRTAPDDTTHGDDAPFAVRVDPSELWLKAGSRGEFVVTTYARNNTTLHLSLHDPANDSVHARLDRDTIHGGNGRALVHVAAMENAAPGNYSFGLLVRDDVGNERGARLLVHVAAPRPPDECPRTQDTTTSTNSSCARPSFAIRGDPASQRARGGDTVQFVIHAAAKRDVTLQLSVGELPRGYRATIEPANLTVAPGEPARAVLTVHVPNHGGSARIFIGAVDAASGERAATSVTVHAPRELSAHQEANVHVFGVNLGAGIHIRVPLPAPFGRIP